MKKSVLLVFLLVSSLFLSQTVISADGVAGATKTKIKQELPETVDKEIRSAVSSFSSSERREYYDWYKESYFSMIDRLLNSGIPLEDAKVIEKRLHAMYGANYPKQFASVNNEIADYKNLVQRIKEEQRIVQEKIEEENSKSREEIKEILDNSNIEARDLRIIELNAKKQFPDNYTLQKAYIKGAIQTYLELKNMIKK